MKTNQGFSLLELMITVGIIGILTMMAVPMYKDYTLRVRVKEGFALAEPMKKRILENFFDSSVHSWHVARDTEIMGDATHPLSDNVESISSNYLGREWWGTGDEYVAYDWNSYNVIVQYTPLVNALSEPLTDSFRNLFERDFDGVGIAFTLGIEKDGIFIPVNKDSYAKLYDGYSLR